jgi:hypothetical protein
MTTPYEFVIAWWTRKLMGFDKIHESAIKSRITKKALSNRFIATSKVSMIAKPVP